MKPTVIPSINSMTLSPDPVLSSAEHQIREGKYHEIKRGFFQ